MNSVLNVSAIVVQREEKGEVSHWEGLKDHVVNTGPWQVGRCGVGGEEWVEAVGLVSPVM